MGNNGEKEQQPKPASNVEGHNKKLDLIIRRLNTLENLIIEKPEYEGLEASLRLTKVGLGLYDKPLKGAARLKRAGTTIKKPEVARDGMSRCIIQASA